MTKSRRRNCKRKSFRKKRGGSAQTPIIDDDDKMPRMPRMPRIKKRLVELSEQIKEHTTPADRHAARVKYIDHRLDKCAENVNKMKEIFDEYDDAVVRSTVINRHDDDVYFPPKFVLNPDNLLTVVSSPHHWVGPDFDKKAFYKFIRHGGQYETDKYNLVYWMFDWVNNELKRPLQYPRRSTPNPKRFTKLSKVYS
jgi:hypothetical protein